MGLNFTDAVLKSIVQSCKAQHSRHFMLCGTAKHVSTLSHFRIFFLYLISLIDEPTCKESTYRRSSAILLAKAVSYNNFLTGDAVTADII